MARFNPNTHDCDQLLFIYSLNIDMSLFISAPSTTGSPSFCCCLLYFPNEYFIANRMHLYESKTKLVLTLAERVNNVHQHCRLQFRLRLQISSLLVVSIIELRQFDFAFSFRHITRQFVFLNEGQLPDCFFSSPF